MARITESTEYVRRTYTVEERLKMADELAAAHNKLADIKKDQEVVVAQFKDKKLQTEQRVEQLSRSLSTGFEMANVKCRLEWDKPNINEVQYVRTDTGEVVKHRAMLPDEMQEELPLGEEHTDAQAEANVESSTQAAADFFGPGRIENPTAENAAPIPDEAQAEPENQAALANAGDDGTPESEFANAAAPDDEEAEEEEEPEETEPEPPEAAPVEQPTRGRGGRKKTTPANDDIPW